MYRLDELARKVEGTVIGDGEVLIRGVRPFEEARPGDITLATSRRFRQQPESTRASAILAKPGLGPITKPVLEVANPKLAFARLLQLFTEKPFSPLGISPQAAIGSACRIDDSVSIHPFVSIGNEVEVGPGVTLHPGVCIGNGCRIGSRSTLYSNVTLYRDVFLGSNVVIHSGTVIGADGFGYVFDGENQVKIPQTGRVEIGDDVEIGANSCIDRATFGSTVLEKGVKLDNLVHVGHNTRIGANTVVVGCVGISGSVNIGRNCILAGQSGVIDHIKIGDDVTVMVKTAVTRDVPSGSVISGPYGRDHRHELKIGALLRKLPRIYQEWKELKAQLQESTKD